jgi:regulator of telomere elongation helicase 1
MKKLRFHGIEVNFPYEPYECQNAYISKCLEAMISGTHAVLESPTGTGKTLCLLSAVLSYRDHISKKRAHDGQERIFELKKI